MPLIKDSVVPCSSKANFNPALLIVIGRISGNPSDTSLTTLSSVGVTTAIISRLTEHASILPC